MAWGWAWASGLLSSPDDSNAQSRLRTPALEAVTTQPNPEADVRVLTIRVAEKGLNLYLGTACESRGTYFRKLSVKVVNFF